MTPAEKVTKARAQLILNQPFFGALALRLKMIVNNEQPTAATNGHAIMYNEEFINKLTTDQVVGLIAHEVLHCVYLHHLRLGGRNPQKWNYAADHVINEVLLDTNFKLPPDGVKPDPKFKGMHTDDVYVRIPDPPPNFGQGGWGAVIADKNDTATPQSQQMAEADWKMAAAAAAQAAKRQGKMPAGLERLIGELMEPVIPWKDILRQFMTAKSLDDYSWNRPQRRMVAQGLYLPARESHNTAQEFVVCIDTSGSIGEKELNEFASEIAAIHADTRPAKLHVLYCDAAVAHVDTFGPDDELTFAAHGGGGTDFRPPFDWVEENEITPQAFVYLTDGYGAFPDKAKEYPVLWCINNHQVSPPWGEHLTIVPT